MWDFLKLPISMHWHCTVNKKSAMLSLPPANDTNQKCLLPCFIFNLSSWISYTDLQYFLTYDRALGQRSAIDSRVYLQKGSTLQAQPLWLQIVPNSWLHSPMEYTKRWSSGRWTGSGVGDLQYSISCTSHFLGRPRGRFSGRLRVLITLLPSWDRILPSTHR